MTWCELYFCHKTKISIPSVLYHYLWTWYTIHPRVAVMITFWWNVFFCSIANVNRLMSDAVSIYACSFHWCTNEMKIVMSSVVENDLQQPRRSERQYNLFQSQLGYGLLVISYHSWYWRLFYMLSSSSQLRTQCLICEV